MENQVLAGAAGPGSRRDPVALLRVGAERLLGALEADRLLHRVIAGDAALPEYVRFLVGSYHYVRFSGYLLAKTAAGLRHSGRCPTALAALEQKAAEEGPHDAWLLSDLQACGVNKELVKGLPTPTAVRAYRAFSLAQAEAGSPAFLGAAYALEFISMRRAKLAATNLRARRAIPHIEQALTFLEGHGVADEGHIAELEALLSTVSDATDQDDILFSSEVLRRLYVHFFDVDLGGTCFA
jgi:hypothetical protein